MKKILINTILSLVCISIIVWSVSYVLKTGDNISLLNHFLKAEVGDSFESSTSPSPESFSPPPPATSTPSTSPTPPGSEEFVSTAAPFGTLRIIKNIVTRLPDGRLQRNSQDNGIFTFNITGTGNSTANIETTNGAGEWTSSNELQAGTYNIAEIVATGEGWEPVSVTCSSVVGSRTTPTGSAITSGRIITNVTVSAGGTTTCTFNNRKKPTTLTIVKNTEGGNGTFTYEIYRPGEVSKLITPNPSIITRTTSNPSGGQSSGGSAGPFSITPGYTSIREISPPGWSFDRITCATKSFERFANRVDILVSPGDEIRCTFTNIWRPTYLTVNAQEGFFPLSVNPTSPDSSSQTVLSGQRNTFVPGVFYVTAVFNQAENIDVSTIVFGGDCRDSEKRVTSTGNNLAGFETFEISAPVTLVSNVAKTCTVTRMQRSASATSTPTPNPIPTESPLSPVTITPPPPPIALASFSPRAIQACLNSLGFTVAASGPGSPGNETNIIGSLTIAAVRNFQGSRGLSKSSPVSGRIGPWTRAQFLEAGCSST